MSCFFRISILTALVRISLSQFHQIVRMNASMLNTWYDPLPLCLMANSTSSNVSYWKTLEQCKENIPHYRYADGFATLPSSAFANKVRGTCCTEDVPIGERGFDEIVEGYEDGNINRAVMLLYQLSATNRSLLFMGDSMNTQIYAAFVTELGRSNNGGGTIDLEYFEKLWWSTRYGELGLGFKDRTQILNTAKWIPPEGSGYTNPVFIYSINMYYFSMGHHEVSNLPPYFTNPLQSCF